MDSLKQMSMSKYAQSKAELARQGIRIIDNWCSPIWTGD